MKLNKPLFPQLFKGIALFTPGGDLIYGIDPSKQSHWHMHLCAALQEMLGLVEPPHFLVPGYTATIDRWLDPQTLQIWTSAEIYRPVKHHQALLNAVFGTANLAWNVAPWEEEACDPIVLETYRQQFPQLWEDHDLIVCFERSEKLSHSYSFNFSQGYSSVEEPLQDMGKPSRQERLSVEKGYPVVTPTPLESASLQEGIIYPLENPAHSSLDATVYRIPNTDALDIANNAWLTRSRTEQTSSGGTIELTPTDYAANYSAIANTEPFANIDPANSHDDSEKMAGHSKSSRDQGYVLRLFVSGHTVATEQALKSLHQLLENALRHPYTLKVIDIFNHPDQAEENQILATPTLLRVWPLPVRRIVGDLNDVDKVLRILAAPD